MFMRFARLAVCLFFITSLLAQFRAGIQGVVKDSQGGLISNASVTLTSNDTGRVWKNSTSAEGFYSFSGLPPGSYTVASQKEGFGPSTVSVVIHAEELQGQDLTLTPGGIAQTVTVTGSANPALQTENADVSKSITTDEILKGKKCPDIGDDRGRIRITIISLALSPILARKNRIVRSKFLMERNRRGKLVP